MTAGDTDKWTWKTTGDLWTRLKSHARRLRTEATKAKDRLGLDGEQARSWRKFTTNARAYDYYLRAMEASRGSTRRDVELAIDHLKHALALDPDFASAHAVLAGWYRLSVMYGFTRDPQQTLSEAARSAQRAVELDPSTGMGHVELGWIAILRKDFDEGEALLRKAMALALDSSETLGWVALGLMYLGQHSEAIRVADQAMALAPLYVPGLDAVKAAALFHLERFSDALECIAAARSTGYANYRVPAYAAATHAAMGQDEEARAEVARLVELEPSFHVEAWPFNDVFRLAQDRDLLKRNLLRAGAPA